MRTARSTIFRIERSMKRTLIPLLALLAAGPPAQIRGGQLRQVTALRIRTRGERAFLRAAQLGRRDGLHGLGDLPRVDHAADAAPDVENVCHKSVASCQSPVPRNTKTGYWVLATGY